MLDFNFSKDFFKIGYTEILKTVKTHRRPLNTLHNII